MKLAISTVCNTGGRNYNQDYISAAMDGKTGCFVVCDGLGSYVGSEVASCLCANNIISTYQKHIAQSGNPFDTNEFLYSVIRGAHDYVSMHKEDNLEIASSCTTVACVFCDNDKMAIAHIGDTRVYVVKDGKIIYQTRDHSLAQVAVDNGDISLHEIRQHKDQNKLTRVLGGDYFIAPDVNIMGAPMSKGDGFVICTDGWWEYVYEDEIETIFKLTNIPHDALERMQKRLVKRAPQFNDNFSAIVAMIKE